MLTFATPFPWWLWILVGLWVGSIVLRRGLPPSSDWGRWLDGLIVAYTALLLYMSLKSSLPRDSTWESWPWTLIAGTSAIGVLGGGLWALRSGTTRSAVWGYRLGGLGFSGLASCLESYELAVIGLIACGLVGLDRSAGAVFPETTSPPRSLSGLVAVAATVICVAWLGLVQYAARVELQRPGPSRWFTVIPDVETVQRWREGLLDIVSQEIVPAHVAFAAAVFLLSLLGRRSHSLRPVDAVVVEMPS